ncbi:MAG: hypothetical protein H7234_03010 [Herminiimonas sp.]|nr:hypothetical protein [Herminiimonas sp.]
MVLLSVLRLPFDLYMSGAAELALGGQHRSDFDKTYFFSACRRCCAAFGLATIRHCARATTGNGQRAAQSACQGVRQPARENQHRAPGKRSASKK